MEGAEIFICNKFLQENFRGKETNYGSCHIMFLTQIQQCHVLIACSDKPSSDYHPNRVVTYTNCTDGVSPPPCHLVWNVVDLEEVWVGEVLAV